MIRLNDYRMQVNQRERAAGSITVDRKNGGSSNNDPSPALLIIDDNVKDVDLIKLYLESEPYEVLSASTGQEALSILREKEIDLLLLEILLPDMDGWAVLNKARKIKGYNTVQTLVTSRAEDLYSRVRGGELGVDDYLVKPAGASELKVRIKALLKKKSYVDQLKSGYKGGIDPAMRDQLTGVYNREFLLRFMDLELKRSARSEYPTTLINLFIDELGLSAGSGDSAKLDKWLIALTALLINELRDMDLIARSENAGLTMLLPYCDEMGGQKVISRIRKAITGGAFPLRDELLEQAVSLNLGTVTFPAQARTMNEVLTLLESELEAVSTRHGPGSLRDNEAKNRLHIHRL